MDSLASTLAIFQSIHAAVLIEAVELRRILTRDVH